MRITTLSLALALALPCAAFAQPAPDGAPPPGAPPGAMAPGQGAPEHMKLRDKFNAANITHDGRLTEQQAEAGGLRAIAKNFAVIDKDHKGYVTMQDVQEWHHARHAEKAAQAGAPPPGAGAPPPPAGGQPY